MALRWIIPWFLALLACAGPTPVKQPQAETWDLEFQAKPLSAKEVRAEIAEKGMPLRACFQREKMSSDDLASYVFELIVPNDGGPLLINQLSTTNPKQKILAECLVAVLKTLHFPAHAGPNLRLKIPIKSQSNDG